MLQRCMSISLWKAYSTSTDAEREAHLRRFHVRFQKLKSGELNANASVALNDYEVSIWTHLSRKLMSSLYACF